METQYERIGGGHACGFPMSLCQVLALSRGDAGLYRVGAITGYTEEDLEYPGELAPFTYVQLHLLSAWTDGASESPELRIRGGPIPDGRTALWLHSFKEGEELGLVLQIKEVNRGYPHVHPFAVFRPRSDGRLTNGELFARDGVTEAELRAIIRQARATDCAEDIAPDITEHSHEPPPVLDPGEPETPEPHTDAEEPD